jgi:hypothetical protein
MGFWRQQEIQMARRMLDWHFRRNQLAPPGEEEATQRAAQLVDDAHRIARQRGRNVVAILKELVEEIKR